MGMQPQDRLDNKQSEGRAPVSSILSSDAYLNTLTWGLVVFAIIIVALEALRDWRRK